MSFQNYKMLQYIQIAKKRSGMVLTILVMVMCITLILYSPLNTDNQFKFPVKSSEITVPVPEKIYSIPPQPAQPQTTVPAAEKVTENNKTPPPAVVAPIMVPSKATTTDVVETNKVPKNKLPECPLYVFGDSLYDTGMSFYNGIGPRADSYPYGKTYFKRPAGRFSDGLLIPDFLAQLANLPFPEPYANPLLPEYTKAVNFANAAAGVLVDGRNYSLNLKMQTDYFEEMVGKMKVQYGKGKTQRLLAKAVLVFNIGSNDYTDVWIQNPKPLNSSFVNAFVSKIIGNFTVAVTRMYNQGARKFAFQNYGPMGCLPLYLQPDGHCAEGLNNLAKLHNHEFDKAAVKWARDLPGLKYIVYDFYTALTARLTNGAKYDFKETQIACCGSGKYHQKFTCMEKANFTLCDDIPSHLFFDPAHTTQRGNLQFATEFWNGPPRLVTPYNMKTLCDL